MLHDLTGDTSHKFENVCIMSSVDFEYILNKIGSYISKSNTSRASMRSNKRKASCDTKIFSK